MGANLIGYMVAGPVAIDPTRAGELTRQMMERRETLKRIFKRVVAQGEDGLSDADKTAYAAAAATLDGESCELPGEFERNPDESEEDFAACCDEEVERALGELGLNEQTLPAFVTEFVEFWNGRGSRDSAGRDVQCGGATCRVIFAGEPSWGDEPDGHGYRLLKRATLSGLSDLVGLH
jgi:hypothetical protein